MRFYTSGRITIAICKWRKLGITLTRISRISYVFCEIGTDEQFPKRRSMRHGKGGGAHSFTMSKI